MSQDPNLQNEIEITAVPNRSAERQMLDAANRSHAAVSEAAESIDALHVEADRARSVLGFGRRILVPAEPD